MHANTSQLPRVEGRSNCMFPLPVIAVVVDLMQESILLVLSVRLRIDIFIQIIIT